jgi:hypothetical protein
LITILTILIRFFKLFCFLLHANRGHLILKFDSNQSLGVTSAGKKLSNVKKIDKHSIHNGFRAKAISALGLENVKDTDVLTFALHHWPLKAVKEHFSNRNSAGKSKQFPKVIAKSNISKADGVVREVVSSGMSRKWDRKHLHRSLWPHFETNLPRIKSMRKHLHPFEQSIIARMRFSKGVDEEQLAEMWGKSSKLPVFWHYSWPDGNLVDGMYILLLGNNP